MLEPTRTYRDPSGRVVIEEHDDRDTSFAIYTPQPANVLGIAAFSELVRIPMERARRGQLVLSALIATNGSFAGQFVFIEVNVVAYIGSSGTVVFSTALDANQNLADFSWGEPDTYASLGIEARENINGGASGTTTGIDTLSLTIAGAYWR